MDAVKGQEESSGHRLKAGAVLLAAGEGSRMGSVPKCLLRLQDKPLIHRHLEAMRDAGVDDIVVVTGYYYQQIEPVVKTFPVQLVRNPHPEQGQQSSVKLGLHALGADYDVVLIVLADQPLLGSAEFSELLAGFNKRPPQTCVVYPEVNGQRGNPVAFSGEVIAGMLATGKDMGCRKFIDANPALVHKLVTANDRFILDLDTRDDIYAFEQRTGWKLSMPDATLV